MKNLEQNLEDKKEKSFEEQRKVGHMVEEKLAELLGKREVVINDPKDLAYIIDQEIKTKIETGNY